MKPTELRQITAGVRGTNEVRGEELYRFIIANRLTRCLELGTAQGVGTAWMAGALAEMGEGKVVSVDHESSRRKSPPASDMIKRANLDDFVDLHVEPTSYTWFLKRYLEQPDPAPFDLIFIDGSHTWDVDGFAFLLAERILRPGGWILFDDLNWTHAQSADLMQLPQVRALPDEQTAYPQIRAVWDLLVLKHPAFSNFREDADWAWAQKADAPDAPRRLEVKRTLGLPTLHYLWAFWRKISR